MRQSIKFVQKSIDPKPSIVDMIKAYTVLKQNKVKPLVGLDFYRVSVTLARL